MYTCDAQQYIIRKNTKIASRSHNMCTQMKVSLEKCIELALAMIFGNAELRTLLSCVCASCFVRFYITFSQRQIYGCMFLFTIVLFVSFRASSAAADIFFETFYLELCEQDLFANLKDQRSKKTLIDRVYGFNFFLFKEDLSH